MAVPSVSPVKMSSLFSCRLSEWRRMCSHVSGSLSVFFEFLCLNSWAAAQRRQREMNHCRGSSEFPWKLYPVKFNSNKLHSREALIKIIGLLRWRGADAHFLLRCCRALSQSEEWDSHKVHLASDECNYVSASDACRSVCSAWCDALCLRLFTVKLWIFLADCVNRTQAVCLGGQRRPQCVC